MLKKMFFAFFGLGSFFGKKKPMELPDRREVKENTDVLENKLFDLLSSLGGEFHLKAAVRLSEPRRSKEFAKILEKYIADGSLEHSQEIVKFLNRQLTTEELERIFEKQELSECYANAGETACLFLEPKRTEKLKEIRRSCIKRGDIENFQSLSKILNYPITVSELGALLKSQEKRWPGNIPETMELLPESLRTEKLTKYFEKQLEDGDLDEAQEAAKFLNRELTVGQLEMFLKGYIEKGTLYRAKEVVVLLNRKLTVKELECLLEKLIILKEEYNAYEAVSLIGRKLTFDELERLHGDSFSLHYRCNIENIEKQLGRRLTTEELVIVLEKQIKSRSWSDAMETAKRILDINE